MRLGALLAVLAAAVDLPGLNLADPPQTLNQARRGANSGRVANRCVHEHGKHSEDYDRKVLHITRSLRARRNFILLERHGISETVL